MISPDDQAEAGAICELSATPDAIAPLIVECCSWSVAVEH